MVLVAAAVGVLGLGVYLYVEVTATSTAVANVRPRAPDVKASPREHEEPTTPGSDEPRVRPASRVGTALRDTAAPVTSETPTVERPGANIDLKKDELMASANKAYDHGDFDEALVIAKKVLVSDPANVRMLRSVVSASCILDDSATAQRSYLALPAGGNDRADMRKRCDRYGVTFTES